MLDRHKNSAIELSTLPYINPSTGISTEFLKVIRLMIKIKSRLAAKQKSIANSILLLVLALGSIVSQTKIPSLAASKPPDVAGSTNLLRTMCCRITPLTDNPTPVKSSAINCGIRLAVMVNHASLEKLKSATIDVC